MKLINHEIVFASIEAVVDKFNEVVSNMTKETVMSVTLRSWIEETVIDGNFGF